MGPRRDRGNYDGGCGGLSIIKEKMQCSPLTISKAKGHHTCVRLGMTEAPSDPSNTY